MGRKRFYDAVRDLIRDVHDHDQEHDPPEQPARTRRRLSIASLLAAPQTCAACWDPVPTEGSLFACNNCLGAYCPPCLTQYARTALHDRQLLPLRCADQQCHAPVPLSALNGLLSAPDIAKLSRFQCEILRRPDHSPDPAPEHPSTPDADPAADPDADEALQSLMGTMGWRRCPDCGTGIERTHGCPHMVCVCGGEFCYSCGEQWLGGGIGCPRHCGLPQNDDDVLMLVPGRFEELRDELWQRFAALLYSLRTVRIMREREAWQDDVPRGVPVRGNGNGVAVTTTALPAPTSTSSSAASVSRTVTRSVTRNAARNDAQPVKMRLRSLVHPSRENRL